MLGHCHQGLHPSSRPQVRHSGRWESSPTPCQPRPLGLRPPSSATRTQAPTPPHGACDNLQAGPGGAGRPGRCRKVIMSGRSKPRSMGPGKEVACESVSSAAHYRHGIDSSIVIRRHARHVKSCPLKCIRQGLLPPFPRALLAANNLPRAF